jgi:hypothetical protein
MTGPHPLQRSGEQGALSYPATGHSPLPSLNRILLIFNSIAAISSHATDFS